MSETRHPRYQDYVIRDGQFVGKFEEMYRDHADPWHQSEPAYMANSYSRWMTILTMRHLGVRSVLEVGCGFGHYTAMIHRETGADVTGIDIAPTAIAKAQAAYPQLRFAVGSVPSALEVPPVDAVLFAEVTWYLLEQLEAVVDALRTHWSGKLFLHNLVFYKGQQRYAAS
jgi:SAM-dependent methyltransferase